MILIGLFSHRVVRNVVYSVECRTATTSLNKQTLSFLVLQLCYHTFTKSEES